MSYPYSEMSSSQIDEFLAAPRSAIVGTSRKDGSPQLSPVWYLWENGKMYFSIYANSAKYYNLARDPRIGLCIASEHPDSRTVMMYGEAKFHAMNEVWTEDLVGRLFRLYYNGDEEAQPQLEEADPAPEAVLVEVTPDRILAQDYN